MKLKTEIKPIVLEDKTEGRLLRLNVKKDPVTGDFKVSKLVKGEVTKCIAYHTKDSEGNWILNPGDDGELDPDFKLYRDTRN